MKSDLDTLMARKNVDYLLITGPAQHNAPMVYMMGGGHVTGADLVKKRGEPAVLFHPPMERDEAAHSGLRTISYNQYPFRDLLQQSGGDRIRAIALRYKKMLEELGISGGRALLYGQGDAGTHVAIFSALQELMPDLTLVPEPNGSLLLEARATKDEEEVRRIRNMGKVTTEVVGLVHDYLSRQTAREGVLVDASGNPVTIGQVKGLINRWLAERGAENPEGTIFSQGRDAAIPHSTGKNEEALRLGVPIVFDIYPCEAGGGYFYDFTRTWCLGYAPDAVTSVYEDVRRVYETLLGEYEVAKPCAAYQARACDLFAGLGHPTIQQNPETEEGFVHSLGHGLGLNIHEQPWFSASMGAQDLIHPGSVFTLEPGLYYPDREIGVRLEDTIWITPQGLPQVLAEYPMDLVIPVK